MAVAFELRTTLAVPIEETFDLARNIDAHVGSMSHTSERAVAGVTSGLIGAGDEVTWRARHFGIPFRLTSRITAMDRPHSFIDEQVRGPFRSFRHEHLFTPIAGGTLMVDRVEFTAPFGPIGFLAERLVLARYLRRLLARRNRYLAESIG